MTYYDLNMNNKRIINVQDPSANQDVATKKYIDLFNLRTPYYYPTQNLSGRVGGIIASNIDQVAVSSLNLQWLIVPSGCPVFYSVYLKAGTVITNGLVFPTVAGSNLVGFFGIYNKSGSLLGSSFQFNLVSGFNINVMNTIALSSPLTITTSDFYYLSLLINSSSLPSFYGAGSTALANLINYPQTTTEVNTGDLSKFRSAVTTASTSGNLPAGLFSFTLQNFGPQFWIGIN